MARRLKPDKGKEVWVENEYVEWAVEYDVGGEQFVVECEDEAEARVSQSQLGGRLVTRTVYETSWADAPDD